MRKTLALCMLLLAITFSSKSQTSTEQFETESVGSSSFTDNGVIFNILSHNATFDIYSQSGAGWSGVSTDSQFIDNTGTATSAYAGASFSIKTTSNLFKVNRFWIYVANALGVQTTTGTVAVTGKLSGVTKFTQTKTTGFVTSTSPTNGYTLIDLTNLNGQNYSNIIIDQLTITLGGDYRYASVDAFTWVKQAATLPVTLTDFSASLTKSGLLKADWKTASETDNSHFILQSSQDGKIWKDLIKKDGASNGASGGAYHVELSLLEGSLAGLSLFGFLLLPFNRRRRLAIAFAYGMLLFVISCSKEKEDSWMEPNENKFTSENPIYVRLAQVDRDGTTTYSKTLLVKAK